MSTNALPGGKNPWVHVECKTRALEHAGKTKGRRAKNRKRSRRSTPPQEPGPTKTDTDVATVKRDLRQFVTEYIDTEMSGVADTLKEQVKTSVMTRLAKKVLEDLDKRVPREVVITHVAAPPRKRRSKAKRILHAQYHRILKLAAARKSIFLPGPTGCGKSYVAEQVATELGLKYYDIACTEGMSEGQITGYLLPVSAGGRYSYVPVGFVQAYEKGGLFLFDEFDAADANTVLIINNAIANGTLSLPRRHTKPVAKKHKNFVLIAAANTWGTGADRRYVGRNQLDAATLDRFRIGITPMDYDRDVEKEIVQSILGRKQIGEELLNQCWQWRDNIRAARLEREVSTRFIKDSADMIALDDTMDDIERQCFEGWTPDEIRIAKGGAV